MDSVGRQESTVGGGRILPADMMNLFLLCASVKINMAILESLVPLSSTVTDYMQINLPKVSL